MLSILNLGSQQISKLALFIFIIAGNFVGDVFSCSLRQWLKENMLIKHLVAFFILLLFVGLEDETTTMTNKILLSIGLYIWFIFTMRSPMVITVLVILSIVVLYIIQGFIKDYEKINKNTDLLINVRNYLFLGSMILSFLGFIYFVFYIKSRYKDFSFFTFTVGLHNNDCFKEKNLK